MTDPDRSGEQFADKVTQAPPGLFQYCIAPGCEFTAKWRGGSAADDPAIPHLEEYPHHTVRSGSHIGHYRLMKMQEQGKMGVTVEIDPENWRPEDV